MNTDHINKLTNNELPKAAGEVLQLEKESYCDLKYDVHDWDHLDDNTCIKCGINRKERTKFCSVADPIPLTWPEAMKWRDWAVEKFGIVDFRRSMEDVHYYCGRDFPAFGTWLSCYTQPEHYIKAAMICVEGSKV